MEILLILGRLGLWLESVLYFFKGHPEQTYSIPKLGYSGYKLYINHSRGINRQMPQQVLRKSRIWEGYKQRIKSFNALFLWLEWTKKYVWLLIIRFKEILLWSYKVGSFWYNKVWNSETQTCPIIFLISPDTSIYST